MTFQLLNSMVPAGINSCLGLMSSQKNNRGQTTVSRRQLEFDFFPRPRRQCYQHVQAELLKLAAYQVGDA